MRGFEGFDARAANRGGGLADLWAWVQGVLEFLASILSLPVELVFCCRQHLGWNHMSLIGLVFIVLVQKFLWGLACVVLPLLGWLFGKQADLIFSYMIYASPWHNLLLIVFFFVACVHLFCMQWRVSRGIHQVHGDYMGVHMKWMERLIPSRLVSDAKRLLTEDGREVKRLVYTKEELAKRLIEPLWVFGIGWLFKHSINVGFGVYVMYFCAPAIFFRSGLRYSRLRTMHLQMLDQKIWADWIHASLCYSGQREDWVSYFKKLISGQKSNASRREPPAASSSSSSGQFAGFFATGGIQGMVASLPPEVRSIMSEMPVSQIPEPEQIVPQPDKTVEVEPTVEPQQNGTDHMRFRCAGCQRPLAVHHEAIAQSKEIACPSCKHVHRITALPVNCPCGESWEVPAEFVGQLDTCENCQRTLTAGGAV